VPARQTKLFVDDPAPTIEQTYRPNNLTKVYVHAWKSSGLFNMFWLTDDVSHCSSLSHPGTREAVTFPRRKSDVQLASTVSRAGQSSWSTLRRSAKPWVVHMHEDRGAMLDLRVLGTGSL
jgi:hypothetical protein